MTHLYQNASLNKLEKVKILLKEDKKLRNKIEKQVKSYLGL